MNEKIKICYILSKIDRAVAFEWITQYLDRNILELHFFLLNPGTSYLEHYLLENGILVKMIRLNGLASYPRVFITLVRYFFSIRPDIIHCHLIDASLLGLLAGKLTGIKKRIYTRHHSTYNWQYNAKGVKLDKFISWLATDIVAPSENVKNVLVQREKVHLSKIHLIHHGFELKAFHDIEDERIQSLNQKYNPGNKGPVIGVIARWIEWKGIQYIIPAFKNLLRDYPNALLLLANANGPYKQEIKNLLIELPESSYTVIDFEPELFTLYQLFDVYLHTPIDSEIEAFGQTYVEALAAGIPSVFTLSGVTHEFIHHDENAFVVPYKNAGRIYEAVKEILENDEIKNILVSNGLKAVKKYPVTKMIQQLSKLYLDGKVF